jgi:C-terminal processing protease CtpA/Prc
MWMPLVAVLAVPGALRAQDDDCPCRQRPGIIGVMFDSEPGRGDGVRVIEVRPGSPAAAAGMREGDIVVRLNGEDATETMDALPGRLQAGDTVRLRVRREGGDEREYVVVAQARPATRVSMIRPGAEGGPMVIMGGDSLTIPIRELTVRLDSLHTRLADLGGSRFRVEVDSLVRVFTDSADVWRHRLPNVEMRFGEPLEAMEILENDEAVSFEEGRPFFMELGRRSAAGAELAEMNEGLSAYFGGQRQGALVIEVSPESPAARAGLQPGDVIVRAGGQDVDDPADVRSALNGAGEGRVALEVVRQGRRRELSLEWTGRDRVFHREILPGREPGERRREVRERVRVRAREN